MVLFLSVITNDAFGSGPGCSPCDSYDFDGYTGGWRCMGCIADCGTCYSCDTSNPNNPSCKKKFDSRTQSSCCDCRSICNGNDCKSCVSDGSGTCQSSCDPNKCQTCDGNGGCPVCGGDANKACCNGSCCDLKKCETCVDGSCKVCGGDPNSYCCGDGHCCPNGQTCCGSKGCCDPATQKCCNGSCCDKVWIKKTIPAIVQSCPPCVGNSGCAGHNIIMAIDYYECSNVGVGSGEHCQCNFHTQPIGYVYACINNFDVSKMLKCLAKGAWCAAICAVTIEDNPSECANCLAENSEGCCDGTCHLCDFIESCDPDTEEDMVPIVGDVFTGFGC